MARSIRVLVANRPKLMRELILSTLSDEPGVEIVGEVADEAEIAERVREVSPDLLVIALDRPSKRPQLCDTLLHDHPGLRIIAVASQENCSVFYWASFDIHSSEIEASFDRRLYQGKLFEFDHEPSAISVSPMFPRRLLRPSGRLRRRHLLWGDSSHH